MEAATAPQVQAPAPAAAAPAASYAAPEAAPAPAPQEMKLIAAALPAGDPAAFDRDSLSSICSHLTTYEASAKECAKALKALSPLAYSKPKETGENSKIVQQVLRLLALHPTDDFVQLYGIKVLGNIASDPSVALNVICTKEVLGAIVACRARKPDSADINTRSSEAVVCAVRAQVNSTAAIAPDKTALRCLFAAIVASPADAQIQVVVKLLEQIVDPEQQLLTLGIVAKSFIEAGPYSPDSGQEALGWLKVCGALAAAPVHEGRTEKPVLPTQAMAGRTAPEFEGGTSLAIELVKHGAMNVVAKVMQALSANGHAQFLGMGTISSLVGDSKPALGTFAELKGTGLIEAALIGHPNDLSVQARGIRALAGATMWPKFILEKTGYTYQRAIEITKAGMKNNPDALELQNVSGLPLVRYLACGTREIDPVDVTDSVKADGGVALIKTSYQKVSESDEKLLKIETRSKIISFLAALDQRA